MNIFKPSVHTFKNSVNKYPPAKVSPANNRPVLVFITESKIVNEIHSHNEYISNISKDNYIIKQIHL